MTNEVIQTWLESLSGNDCDIEVGIEICAQAKEANVLRAEIDRLKAEATYEGQTASEWHDAWDRADDRWQKMVQHHEEVEEAVKVFMHNVVTDNEWSEDLNVLDRILDVKGSAPQAQPKETE